MYKYLFLTVEAVGAELAAVDAGGLQGAVQGLIADGVEAHLLLDPVQQSLAALGVGVGVLLQMLLAAVALQLLDDPPGQQLHFAVAPGEIQVLAAMHDGRTGRTHVDLPDAAVPFSYDYDEIEAGLNRLAQVLGVPAPDFSGKRDLCAKALEEARAVVGDRPIAIDYTFCPRPLGLAKLLLQAGFRVERVYLDVITGEEKAAFAFLKEHYPNLMLYPTVHAAMRFHSPGEISDFVAIGQKAAHFTNTPNFVNVVEGGGMLGYQAILKTMKLLQEAVREEKDLRGLIQIKGMGCGGCV